MIWIAGAVLALITAGESALRNYRRNRLEQLLRHDAARARLVSVLEGERELLDSLLILRLIATIALTLAIADAATGEALSQHLGELVRSWPRLPDPRRRRLRRRAPRGARRPRARAARPHRPDPRDRPPPVPDPLAARPARLGRLAPLRARGARRRRRAEFREEILDAVSGGEQTGVIEEAHAEMIEKLVDFRDSAVSEVMTPGRGSLAAVDRRSRARSPPRTNPAIRGSRCTRRRSTASSASCS